jgi:hypothetical protein
MIRNLYEVLAEADSEPKAKSKEKPKAKPVPHEEPLLTVKLVDGKKTRDSIAVDFIGGGHYYAYPDLIPKDEVWIEQDLAPDEQADILVHELVEYALMSKGGMTYTPAHNLANKLEKVFRNFEGRWKTKQAPDGDKKVEEGLIAESYSMGLMAFLKYLKAGIDPHDFAHEIESFYEDLGEDPPESFDVDEPYNFLDTPEFAEVKDKFVRYLETHISPNMADLPTYLFLSGAKLLPRQTWLIHFSDDAGDIAENGFEFGAEDFTQIGLTTHMTDNKRRQGHGWNFALKANDRDVKLASKKYGEEAVMFQSAGVEAYHQGDNEQQVVFWGPNVKERFYLQNDGGDWVVKNPLTDKELVRSESIFDAIGWVEQNHAQYRKAITNNQKAKPIQPTPKADRERLLAKTPEKTPQPFEAVAEANSNHTFTAYHGTARQFAAFKLSNEGQFGPGVYLASTFDDAKEFGWNSQAANEDGNKTAPIQVLKVKVSFKNPVYGKGDGIIDEVTNITGETLWPKINAKLQKLGHDGLVITFPDGKREYVAFNPSQVKILNRSVVKEAENVPGTCPKCGLAKHRSIPHLCSKGRSKWGAKGGKFTTPERPAFKTKAVTEGEEDLLVVVKQYASNKHPDDHLPEDYHWARDKAFNTEGLIHMMPGGLAGWRSFLGDAVKESPDKYAKLSKTEKIDDPVILSPGHIWDGWHRIAAAIVNGHKTIPAIVGKLNAR